jgi:hypothetical protein
MAEILPTRPPGELHPRLGADRRPPDGRPADLMVPREPGTSLILLADNCSAPGREARWRISTGPICCSFSSRRVEMLLRQ